MQVVIAPPTVDAFPEAPAPVEAGGKPERSSQTLTRALDILDAVRGGPISLPDLERQLGLSRSTVHRLATVPLGRYQRREPADRLLGAALCLQW